MAYTNKTTQELEDLIKEINSSIKELLLQKQSICYKLTMLRGQKRSIHNTLYSRKKSPYKGEFYINSAFRKKYGKSFSALSSAEKRMYYKEVKKRHIEKLKSAEKNTNNSE